MIYEQNVMLTMVFLLKTGLAADFDPNLEYKIWLNTSEL